MHTNETLVPPPHAPRSRPAGYEDPLDEDALGDAPLLTTRRSVIRVALAAAETASRFAREGTGHDAMAWLTAPRRMYGGATAIDACLDRDACLRTVLLHGLSLGLDADPEDLDELADDGFDDRADGGRDDVADGEGGRRAEASLYTCAIACRTASGFLQSFDAVVAHDAAAAAEAFAVRRGVPHVDVAEIDEGFDRSHPLAVALLSPAVTDMLIQVAAEPWSPLAAGLSVSVEQRFVE